MAHELRRTDLEITDPDLIDRILSGARFATVALVDGDRPYLVTLSCGYDRQRNRLCFHVAPSGRKLDVIASNANACATVIGDLGYKSGECAHPYESVVLFGTMRVVDDLADAQTAMRALIRQLESAQDEAAGLGRCRMLVFDIEDLTAKTGQ